MRPVLPWLVALLACAPAAPAFAQIGGPVGGAVGGPVGAPVGGAVGGQAVTGAVSGAATGLGIPPVNSADDDDALSPGVSINTGRGLNYSADVIAEYGSNLLRIGDGQPLRANVRSRADWRIRPSLGVQAGLPLGGQQVYVNALVGRDFYARNSFLNRERIEGTAGVAYRLGGACGGRIQGGYAQRQTQIEEFEDIQNSLRRVKTALASFGCQNGVGLSPQVGLDYTSVTNSLPRRRLFNIQRIGANAGVNYALGVRGAVGVSGNISRTTFVNNPFVQPDPATGQLVFVRANRLLNYGASINGNYRLGQRFVASGSIGYNRTTRAGAPATGTPIYSASLGYTGQRLTGSVSASRTVFPGQGGEAALINANAYVLDVGYRLAGATSVYAGVARNQRDFRGEIGFVDVIRRDQTLDRVYAGARTTFGRFLNAGAEVNHIRRRADPSVFDFTSTGVRLSLGASF